MDTHTLSSGKANTGEHFYKLEDMIENIFDSVEDNNAQLGKWNKSYEVFWRNLNGDEDRDLFMEESLW